MIRLCQSRLMRRTAAIRPSAEQICLYGDAQHLWRSSLRPARRYGSPLEKLVPGELPPPWFPDLRFGHADRG